MKMTTICSKLAHKEVLGAVLALRIFLTPRGELSLPQGFWEPCNFSSRLIWLLLQLMKL